MVFSCVCVCVVCRVWVWYVCVCVTRLAQRVERHSRTSSGLRNPCSASLGGGSRHAHACKENMCSAKEVSGFTTGPTTFGGGIRADQQVLQM